VLRTIRWPTHGAGKCCPFALFDTSGWFVFFEPDDFDSSFGNRRSSRAPGVAKTSAGVQKKLQAIRSSYKPEALDGDWTRAIVIRYLLLKANERIQAKFLKE